jgi:ADP-heptose:LPS heptosyltransferase
LFDTPGFDFYSLQKDDAARQLAEEGLADGARRSQRRLADFTAALLFNLDFVITCDTAVAHLARALAKPTCLLLPLAGGGLPSAAAAPGIRLRVSSANTD